MNQIGRRLPTWMTYLIIGAAIGGVAGAGGVLREVVEGHRSWALGPTILAALTTGAVGLLGGLILYALRPLMKRGVVAYYAAWGLSVGLAVTVFVSTGLLFHGGPLREVLGSALLGIGGGLGLALFIRQVRHF